jgi:hypothetical protein
MSLCVEYLGSISVYIHNFISPKCNTGKYIGSNDLNFGIEGI